MSFTAYCLTCRQFGCICTPIIDNAPLFKKLRGINEEIKLMAKYIDINPDNAICDTLWHGNAETMMDALLRLSDELSALVPPNACDQRTPASGGPSASSCWTSGENIKEES